MFGLSASTVAGIASAGAGLLTGGGKSGSQSTKQEMDPRMVPYVFGGEGKQGLLDVARDQLYQSRSPERMQGWNTMMNRGQSLMGGSIAGNPFSSGYQGGSLFPARAGNGLPQYTPSPLPKYNPPAATGPTIDEIIAEIERRRMAQEQDQGWRSGETAN